VHRQSVTLLIAAAFLAWPGMAHAAPTQTPPTAASLADSRPLLSWTLGADEGVHGVYVASSAGVTPEGKFYDETTVDSDWFSSDQRLTSSWQPTRRIPAGTYWWNLEWELLGDDSWTTSYTPPVSFTIPTTLRVVGVSIRQWVYSTDTVTVAYVTNAQRATVACSVYHGRRLIARRSRIDTGIALLARDSSACEVNVARTYAGKRLRLVGEVRAGGKVARMTRYFYGIR
jgi:hypothetical protein